MPGSRCPAPRSRCLRPGRSLSLPHAATLIGTELELDAPGFAVTRVKAQQGHTTRDTPPEIAIAPPTSLVVRLVDESGAPVYGFVITLEQAPQGALREDAWTAAAAPDGTYRFESLPADTVLRPLVEGSEVVRVHAPLLLAPGEVRELTWVVDRGCRVTGSVLDETGAPAPRALVTLAPVFAATAGKPLFSLRCDSLGAFELPDVGAGTWQVKAMSATSARS